VPTERVWFETRENAGATEFLGYEREEADGVVQSIVVDGANLTEASTGAEIAIVVNQTPFYGESGGQQGDAGTITHLEDEPRKAFERLRASGLALGKPLVVRAGSKAALEIEIDGRVVSLPRVLAPAVTIARHPARPTVRPVTLADLAPGDSGRVRRLSPSCRGAQRRRLLDLGVVPGTEIGVEFRSAGGDPVAYRIRGALIALRHSQAEWVEIEGRP